MDAEPASKHLVFVVSRPLCPAVPRSLRPPPNAPLTSSFVHSLSLLSSNWSGCERITRRLGNLALSTMLTIWKFCQGLSRFASAGLNEPAKGEGMIEEDHGKRRQDVKTTGFQRLPARNGPAVRCRTLDASSRRRPLAGECPTKADVASNAIDALSRPWTPMLLHIMTTKAKTQVAHVCVGLLFRYSCSWAMLKKRSCFTNKACRSAEVGESV